MASTSFAVKIKAYIELMRPTHWVKNFFIFAPLLLSKQLANLFAIGSSLTAFAAFSLIVSGIYAINDVADIYRDREHPIKRLRPVSSGRVSPKEAIFIASCLIFLGALTAKGLSKDFFIALVSYVILNLLYSWVLKHIVLLDIFAVAANYVLRIIAGTVVISEPITAWVIILATLLALFLAIGKRRSEFVNLPEGREAHRRTLREYNQYFLDQLITIVATAAIMAWSLYTLDPVIADRLETAYLPLTIPLVLYGIFRYLYLVHIKGKGESPTHTLLADPPLLITVGLWFISIVIIRLL